MTQISFFMLPSEFFEIVKTITIKFDMKINFRRYKSETEDAAWKTVSSNEDLESIFLNNNFKTIYFSLNKIPSHDKDWGFTDTADDELLELSGGKVFGNILEMFELRVFHKKSKAKKLFTKIVEEIKKISDAGKLVSNGVLYPKTHFSKKALEMDMRSSVDGNKYRLEAVD